MLHLRQSSKGTVYKWGTDRTQLQAVGSLHYRLGSKYTFFTHLLCKATTFPNPEVGVTIDIQNLLDSLPAISSTLENELIPETCLSFQVYGKSHIEKLFPEHFSLKNSNHGYNHDQIVTYNFNLVIFFLSHFILPL